MELGVGRGPEWEEVGREILVEGGGRVRSGGGGGGRGPEWEELVREILVEGGGRVRSGGWGWGWA